MNNRLLVPIVLLIVIALAVVWYTSNDVPVSQSAEPIRIGLIAPLTGNQAFVGEGARDALKMALEDLGDTRYRYEIIVEDNQLNPKLAVSAAEKLITVDKVDALITLYAPIGNVISPVAERNKVIHFGIAFDPNIAKGDYNFMHFTPPSEEARAFVEELKKRDIEKLAIMRLNHQGVIAVYEALKPLLEKEGIKIVADEEFQPGERDFKNSIAIAKTAVPEVYVLFSTSPELEILTKQIRDAQIDTPLTTITYFEFSTDRTLFNGSWFVGSTNPEADFVKKFEAKYGDIITSGAANVYDAFNLIVAAAEKSDSPNKPTTDFIASELYKIEGFDGVLGELNINADGTVWSKAQTKLVQDGKFIAVE